MTNEMTVTVALVAICVVDLILIWQASTLADEVRGLDEGMRVTEKWFAHMETSRFWMTRKHEDGDAARKIKPPRQVTDDDDAWQIVTDAGHIARTVSRYSRFTEQNVLECIMRLVGHLCAIGGSPEDREVRGADDED